MLVYMRRGRMLTGEQDKISLECHIGVEIRGGGRLMGMQAQFCGMG